MCFTDLPGWHSDWQNPQLPWSVICSPVSSTNVEHHASVSPGPLPANVQQLYAVTPWINGKTQVLFGSAPLSVLHFRWEQSSERN